MRYHHVLSSEDNSFGEGGVLNGTNAGLLSHVPFVLRPDSMPFVIQLRTNASEIQCLNSPT